MDVVRKAYQQAVQIPMENDKRLWEDYQDFENNLNKITVSPAIPAISALPSRRPLPCPINGFIVIGEKVHFGLARKSYASAHGPQSAARAPDRSLPPTATQQG